ncbi:MAG: dockerin type I repeat-containing protein [candidate division Zixibacteria bacterium]|nr:dockerin type I repeat-containing protein [candidate division Zixibacteria bacterium]
MRLYRSIQALAIVILFAGAVWPAEKRAGRVEKIGEFSPTDIRIAQRMATADTCIVRSDAGIIMRIDGWVIGQELYKQYLDPAASCENPYPFSVLEINMPMIFDAPGDIVVSVDVEAADLTDPTCPVPGQLIDSSVWWQYTIPAAGLYNIWVPLDEPVVVNGPFFAGFLISNTLTMNAAVLTDTSRVPCVSYNIWDSEIGFVDLGQYIYDDGQFYFEWPGRLVLYASGVPGGNDSGTDPLPQLEWVSPAIDDSVLYESTELWAVETSGSRIVDYVIFEFNSGSGFQSIGMVYDGVATTRNGVDPATPSAGYSLPWNFASLPEGPCTIRVTAIDTLGRSSSVERVVILEPTPPIPYIVNPSPWSTFCSSIHFFVNCSDEDISSVEFKGRAIPDDFTIGLYEVDQTLLGDVDHDPYDGNSIANGEFGEYYCGPAAAAVAIQEWYDRGYTELMQSGAATLGIAAVAESLAVMFQTRANEGTRDDLLVRGLQQWIAAHGGRVSVDFKRSPKYVGLRTWVQDDERVVLLGLGGDPGLWVAVDGFLDWETAPNTYLVSIMNPLTGSVQDVPFRESGGVTEMQITGEWHSVDLMVSLLAPDWSLTRALLGKDLNGADGWSYLWTPHPLTEGDWFFMWAATEDANRYAGHTSVLMQYICENTFSAGDYNGDGGADIVDLYYMIQYITLGGPAPAGGPQRADANCDTYINIADIVYFMNYLYGTASTPCY